MGGELILKKLLGDAAARKNFFRPSGGGGVRGHAPPENFKNIVFRIG